MNRAARICSAGHGGQVLVSSTVRALVGDRFEFLDLGSYALAGIPRPEQIYQLLNSQTAASFPPFRAPASGVRNNRRSLGRRSRQKPTLSSAAWRVRAAIPSVDNEDRSVYAELGAGLFSAARAVERADAFLDRVDNQRLAERLAEYQELALFSEPAALETKRIRDQIAAVEHPAVCANPRPHAPRACPSCSWSPVRSIPPTLSPFAKGLSSRGCARPGRHSSGGDSEPHLLQAQEDSSPWHLHLRVYIVPYRDDAGTNHVGEFVRSRMRSGLGQRLESPKRCGSPPRARPR